jgi:hypothetical protein
MPSWTCPDCQRRFGRRNQSHECAPAMSLDDYLATGPAHERPIVEAVLDHLESLGPIHVEPVSVGILLKRGPTFAELRPMTRWERLTFTSTSPISHPRIASRPARTWYAVNLRTPEEFDDQVRAWLTAAYLATPE